MDRTVEEEILAQDLVEWVNHPITRSRAAGLVKHRSTLLRELLHASSKTTDPKIAGLYGRFVEVDAALSRLGQRRVEDLVQTKLEVVHE